VISPLPRLAGSDRWIPLLPALAGLAALGGYAALAAFPVPGADPVPSAAPVAAAAFALLQLFVPRSRPVRSHVLSPLNWAVLAFFLQLVVMPLVVATAGPEQAVLPRLPERAAIDQAILLAVAAFAAFTVGCALARGPRRATGPAVAVRLSPSVMLLYAALGVGGLLVRFGSLGEVLANLGDPTRLIDLDAEQSGTLRGAASTFLRPFLLTGLAMAWSRWLDRPAEAAGQVRRVAITAATAAAVLVVGATYGFNRAAFIVPLVAMAAAYAAPARRLSLTALALAGVVAVLLSEATQHYRAGGVPAAELTRSGAARQRVFDAGSLPSDVQVYGAAPQFAGFVLEAARQRGQPFTPRVLLASLLSPVPVLGKGFRDESGPVIYNQLIYGTTGVVDQILPFEAEVFLCLGPGGLAVAFLLLGAVVARLQRVFERAGSAFDRYALQFAAMWLTFLVQGSLSAVSQVFVFFMWPFYGYALLRVLSTPWRPSAPAAAATAGAGFPSPDGPGSGARQVSK
jgi:hypothetical protein